MAEIKTMQEIEIGSKGWGNKINQNSKNFNDTVAALNEAIGSGGSGGTATSLAGHNNVVYYNPTSGPSIIVGFKYGSNKDFFVEFKKCGVNNILAMYKFYEAANTNDEVMDDALREKTELKQATTDFISPTMVKCIDSSVTVVEDASQAFTGGWHGYNGDQSGNSTAKTSKYELFLDGVKQDYTTTVNKKVDRIDLKVVNYIQAYNTKKATGEGTYVLEETVVYTIIKNTINVSVTLKSLKTCVVETYYGLQSSNSSLWNKSVAYPRGSAKQRFVFADNVISEGDKAGQYAGSTSGTHETAPNCRRWVVRGDNGHALCCFVDSGFSLATKTYLGTNTPRIFTQGYGTTTDNTKTYYNFIKGFTSGSYNGIVLSTSKTLSWRGGYVFTNMTGQGNSVDYIDFVNEYERLKLLFDCQVPCGTLVTSDSLIGKNLVELINEAQKSKTEQVYTSKVDVTQNVNGISVLSSYGYGCLEIDVVDKTV